MNQNNHIRKNIGNRAQHICIDNLPNNGLISNLYILNKNKRYNFEVNAPFARSVTTISSRFTSCISSSIGLTCRYIFKVGKIIIQKECSGQSLSEEVMRSETEQERRTTTAIR